MSWTNNSFFGNFTWIISSDIWFFGTRWYKEQTYTIQREKSCYLVPMCTSVFRRPNIPLTAGSKAVCGLYECVCAFIICTCVHVGQSVCECVQVYSYSVTFLLMLWLLCSKLRRAHDEKTHGQHSKTGKDESTGFKVEPWTSISMVNTFHTEQVCTGLFIIWFTETQQFTPHEHLATVERKNCLQEAETWSRGN